jgi:hypothetical protein
MIAMTFHSIIFAIASSLDPGATVYRYNEQKVEGDPKKPKRHVVRK